MRSPPSAIICTEVVALRVLLAVLRQGLRAHGSLPPVTGRVDCIPALRSVDGTFKAIVSAVDATHACRADLRELRTAGLSIGLCHVESHIGVLGNEVADAAAKQAGKCAWQLPAGVLDAAQLAFAQGWQAPSVRSPHDGSDPGASPPCSLDALLFWGSVPLLKDPLDEVPAKPQGFDTLRLKLYTANVNTFNPAEEDSTVRGEERCGWPSSLPVRTTSC